MARHEADREDLIREAVALPHRAEIALIGESRVVTVGFRSNGALSVFFDQDPVYQFDPEGRLRRAYVGGFLFRSQHTGLAKLERRRNEAQTILLRTDLSEGEQMTFRQDMLDSLAKLLHCLRTGEARLLRVVPEGDTDILIRTCETLESISCVMPWLSPLIPARK